MPPPIRDHGGRGARGRALRSSGPVGGVGPSARVPQSAGSGPPLVASVGGVGPSARGVRARRLGCSRRLGRSGALRARSLRSLRARRRPPSSPPRLPPLACSPPRSAALPPPPSAPRSAALPPPPSAPSLAALPPPRLLHFWGKPAPAPADR